MGAGSTAASASDPSEATNEGAADDRESWILMPTVGIVAWVQEYQTSTLAPDNFAPVNIERSSPESVLFTDFAVTLLGPPLEIGSLEARPFVRGGVLLPTNGENTILSRIEPINQTGVAGRRFLDGPDMVVHWAPIYAAGVGVEIVVPGDSTIRLSPSVEFRRTRVDYTGVFERTVLQNAAIQPDLGVRFELEADSPQLYLGPALGAAVGFEPFAGVTVSGYLDVAILFVLDGTRERFGASDPTFGRIDFEFEAEPVSAEVGMGFGIRW
jgi:hypothetical protein